jgi:hypothetical protein
MSEIRVNNIKNEAGTGAPELTYGASIPVGYAVTGAGGINVTGVVTASSFVGALTGTASTATGLSGTPNITVGTISATSLNASGVVTASSFSGSGANLTGISSVSFATTSFGLSGSPNLNVGIITASRIGINTTSTSQQFQVGSGTTIVVIDSTGDLGIGTESVPTKLYVQGNAAGNIVGLGTTTATTTFDFTQGNNFSLILGATITIANPTGVTTGQSGLILIQENSTGGYTCGWGTSWDFASSTAPTLTTTANALNALPYFARSTTSIVVGSVIAGIGTL